MEKEKREEVALFKMKTLKNLKNPKFDANPLKNTLLKAHRKEILTLVMITTALFLTSFISAWSNNTFNNSLTSENLTLLYQKAQYDKGLPYNVSTLLSEGYSTGNWIAQNMSINNLTLDKLTFSIWVSSGTSGNVFYRIKYLSNLTQVAECDLGLASALFTLPTFTPFLRECDFSPDIYLNGDYYFMIMMNDTTSGSVRVYYETTNEIEGNRTENLSDSITSYSDDLVMRMTFNNLTYKSPTRWLKVPENTYVSNGFLNLSRYKNWNLSSFSYDNINKSISTTTPLSLYFSSDGNNLYVLHADTYDIVQYNLSSPYNISSATSLYSIDVYAQERLPQDIFFKLDGTKMYVTGSYYDYIRQYSLSTAWNLST